MTAPLLMAEIEEGEGSRLRILAPAVGWWSDHPPAGALASSGTPIGVLECLTRRFRLVLPASCSGRVADGLPADRKVAVEYRQLLFELLPVSAAEGDDPGQRQPGSGADPLSEGTVAVLAPTDGVFYRRPSPDAPPFVEVGQRIADGQPVGLVEVMKTFNQIFYGGADLPPQAEVVELRCADAAEVRAGQVLVVVRGV